MSIRRIYVEKKPGFDVEAQGLLKELKEHLLIESLDSLKIYYRYDIEGVSDEIYEQARKTVFSEPPLDFVYDEEIEIEEDSKFFAVEYLPGQYDQRADSASQLSLIHI